MIPVWPASLPQRVLAEGFNEGFREGRLQTPPERGVPKLRRGSSAVGKPILQSIKIDAEQLTILEDFWEVDTGGGVRPFWFPDQTRGGIPILTTAGEPILTVNGAALLNSKWWLVQFGGTAPSAGTRSRGMSFVVPVPMTVLYSWGRLISLNARKAMNASATDDGPVMLIKITHATLPAPVYLSSDPTEMFSMDPLKYGTRHQGQDYDFVIMSAIMPDDEKDTPPKTTLAFENVAPDMAAPLRAISSPARIDLTVVMALSPDLVEASYTNLRGVKASYDADAVSLDISREPYTSEPWPSGRFSPARFPGLFP